MQWLNYLQRADCKNVHILIWMFERMFTYWFESCRYSRPFVFCLENVYAITATENIFASVILFHSLKNFFNKPINCTKWAGVGVYKVYGCLYYSHLLLPWSSIGPVDLTVGHSVPSKPIPVKKGTGQMMATMNTTLEERVWMGRICNPNPCEKNCFPLLIQSFYLSSFIFFFSEAPPIHKTEEEVPIVLGTKVIWVPINSPQFCQPSRLRSIYVSLNRVHQEGCLQF